MRIIFKLIPVILISVILYLFVYDLYPKYQELLASAQKLNELKNREEEINALENLIKSLENNANIQQILLNRERINYWLPVKPEAENIVFTLYNLYTSLGLDFPGTDFQLSEEETFLIPQLLPVRTINFNLKIKPSNNFLDFIKGIEDSVRVMVIKKAVIKPEESNFEIESYYLKSE